ncbi:Disease resistance protein RPM1 [Dichanthelium oligosanthes]|uniref:Disease resistance protein RPM1 n=1 Tax=Dichanthelium oligosanthes TaxID=888268 RepID=A0A1E5W728_9POAL|nr:Disease resistance protein RPM1 [Dichanthelium oligosanthes]
MEATALSLARSVLDGVLSSAGSAVANEVARLIGVPREVDFIRNELEMMQAFLRASSTHPVAAGRSDTVRLTWVKQVRDLAYDVEDCLLDFALYAARTSSSRFSSWLPGAIAERHRIAERIRDLKASVVELNQRNQRYHIVVENPAPPARVDEEQSSSSVLPYHDTISAELAFQVSDVIGRVREKTELIDMISAGTASNADLRVVSVWGMGGMGKSSLVRMVHNDAALLDEFDYGAWVTVPHPLDSPDVFRRRLRKELGLAHDQRIEDYLRGKRYRVIVDDLLSQEEWEHIWKVFQFGNKEGSLIIVTTRREDVARLCAGYAAEGHGHVYELKPLSDEESMNLLCQKVRLPRQPRLLTDVKMIEHTLQEDMLEQALNILSRCHGLPLAISTIGGLLANRPKTSIEWRNLHEHLGAELGSDLSYITKVIVSTSYDGLQYHLKSIFLYLSIFPENHEIRRTRLLRRWIAEGYIAKDRDMPVEDVGERSYSDLINRSMIQPSKVSLGSVRADRCRVHSMVLQIILPMSIEENQLFIIEKQSNEVPQNKIRHLVVSRWKTKSKKLENINLSYIRSLTIFGECPVSFISPKMQLLRVLDLEDTENLKNCDLKHIGELHHLRYLCLRGTGISKLPSSLQNLRYLETLDIQDTRVRQLPRGVVKLKKLRYLLAGVNFTKELLQKKTESGRNNHIASIFGTEYCKVFKLDRFSVRAPKGIEKLENLYMLGVINVGKGHGVAGRIRKLTNLMNLRRLGITGLTEEEGEELCKPIRELTRLQRLEVRSDSLNFLDKIDESEIPKHLVSLRLCGKLTKLPVWVRASSLNNLAKVKLLGTQLKQEDIRCLGNLCKLALLGLWENSYIKELLVFTTGTFLSLKFLDIDRLQSIEKVTIEKGAMPRLEQLWLDKCPSLQDNKDGLSGVSDLLSLKELLLKNCGEKGYLINTLQDQVNRHPGRPKFLIGKSKMPTRTASEQ